MTAALFLALFVALPPEGGSHEIVKRSPRDFRLQAEEQSQAPAEKPGTIRGRITAADTGKPLRRARVTITPLNELGNTPPLAASTNSLGQFEAKNVPAGAYYVAAGRAGYLNVQYGQRRMGERGTKVDVGAGETVEKIDFALPRGGVIGGRIIDDLGEPYPGVRIDVLAGRYNKGKRVWSPFTGGTTDDLGQFRVAGLPPGAYAVMAVSSETWKTDRKETFGYASTYFPGGPADTAQPVTLGVSEQRTDLVFPLHVSRAARITGRVQRENGEPVPGAGVSLSSSFPGAGAVAAGGRIVRTDAGGSFEFKDVPAGNYMVNSEEVTVAGADIEDLLLVVKTGSSVTGLLQTDDGTPPPFPSSGVRVLLSAPFGKVLPTVYVNAVDPDWSFKLTGLGGPFMFRLMGLPADWTLGSVRLNGKDITDTPWDVPTGGKELSGMKIVVTQKIARVTGVVTDENGKPSPWGTVVVFSEDAEHWIPGSRFIVSTRPSADGSFAIPGLPPGTYRAIARDYIEDGRWEDREFLESVREEALRFVLGEGGTERITLKLPAVR